jgi:branched-chain amino acid transport system substrate-binding protein
MLVGHGATAQDTVKVGIIAPFNTPPGEGLLNAARMAAEDINASGGIGGKQLELVIANDEYKAHCVQRCLNGDC